MTFGYQCNEEQSVAILNAAKDHGFTFIDTADVYPIGDMTSGYGATEEILGRWLTGQRDNFILATKCYAPTGPNKWDQGNSRKNIIRAAEESLRRLKTDYIDVYQLHFYDDRVMMEIRKRNFVHPRAASKDHVVRCSHLIGNIRITAEDAAGGSCTVTSNFHAMLCYREEKRMYGGRYEHVLQHTGAGLLIHRKRVDLIDCDAAHKSLIIYL
jgi:aryl-alcohol dehydrogenase-like predicted oxidoreductase